jgi:hypothetical protein
VQTPAYDLHSPPWPSHAKAAPVEPETSTWKATWESMRELMERQEAKLQRVQDDNRALMDRKDALQEENGKLREETKKLQEDVLLLRDQLKDMRVLEQDNKDMKAYILQAQEDNQAMRLQMDRLEAQMRTMEQDAHDMARRLRAEQEKQYTFTTQSRSQPRASPDRRQPSEFYDPRDRDYVPRSPPSSWRPREVATEPRLPSNLKVDFSPGTKFVAELTKVLDLDAGHHAPLSQILDRQLQREMEYRRRSEWER